MNERGEHAMGFSQNTTTHHFLLKPDGGVIQVEANDPKDTASRDNIRMHLGHIARMFADGDFDIPMFVHNTVPPGVQEMKQLQKRIQYTFEETPNGGRVIIGTTDKRGYRCRSQIPSLSNSRAPHWRFAALRSGGWKQEIPPFVETNRVRAYAG